jgi:hypothetical protein
MAYLPASASATIEVNIKEAIVMPVKWIKDADQALQEAKGKNKPLLIDFSAAPA